MQSVIANVLARPPCIMPGNPSSPWWLSALALLGACSAVGTYVEPTLEQPAAIVHGADLGVFSGFSLGQAVDIRILAIGGEALPKSSWSGYPAMACVSPGTHESLVACRGEG